MQAGRAEALQGRPQRQCLGVGGVDHPVADVDPLTTGGAEPHGVAGQPGPGLLGSDVALGHGHTVLVELGVDALGPLRALIDEGLVEANPLPPLQHGLGGDPRLGQVASVEQFPQQSGVAAVGLGVTLAPPGRLGVRRFGQMRLVAGSGDLLDHVAPAGAALHGQRHRLAVRLDGNVVAKPAPEPFPVWLPDPAPPNLS